MAKAKAAAKGKEPGNGLAVRLAREAEKRIAADKARAEELICLIERRKQAIVESFYDIGEALRELLRNKYYVAIGYASFEELLEKRHLLSYTQASKLIEVVDTFSRSKALELGPEKAYNLSRLAKATPEKDTGAELAERDIEVGGKSKKGKEASTRELEAATREARAKTGKAPKLTAQERAAKSAARSAQAALRRAGIKKAVVEAKRAGGAWVLQAALGLQAAGVFEAAWPKR